ncbi:MAG: hypothetical protein ACTHOD_04990 [Motilibacteraceae bacterium]
MTALTVASTIVGVLVLLGTSSSMVRTLIVPRGLPSKLTALCTRATFGAAQLAVRGVRDYEVRDRVLAWAAPLSILVTLAAWLAGYLVAYALVLFTPAHLGLRAAFREAGSSLFTLGFASTDRARLTAVDFLAAATGPVVVGLLISYLSTVYAAYNRREVEVTMLDSRAGEPNWGPVILARHASVRTIDNLRELFRGWERWAADVSESHVNYQVLVFVRSPRPGRSWLVGLLSVMDAAALQLAVAPSLPQGEARIAVRMGFSCLRDLADVFQLPYDPDPDPDGEISLTFAEFEEAYDRIVGAGFPVERTAAEAWPHFRGWRVNYEALAYAIAWKIDAVPARWSGPRRFASATIEPRTPVNREPGGRIGRPYVPEVRRPAPTDPTTDSPAS